MGALARWKVAQKIVFREILADFLTIGSRIRWPARPNPAGPASSLCPYSDTGICPVLRPLLIDDPSDHLHLSRGAAPKWRGIIKDGQEHLVSIGPVHKAWGVKESWIESLITPNDLTPFLSDRGSRTMCITLPLVGRCSNSMRAVSDVKRSVLVF